MRHYCSSRNWPPVVAVYRDNGHSGKDPGRPAFRRMLSDIEEDRINTVVVNRMDRLSRSLQDFMWLFHLFARRGVDLISVTEGFDTSTLVGQAKLGVLIAFAQLEGNEMSERARVALEQRARMGWHNGGKPPIGYDIDNATKGLVPNENEAIMVRDMFDTYEQVKSARETVIACDERGYRTRDWTDKNGTHHPASRFSKASILGLLRNPVYIGKVRYRGAIYDGRHPGIIDPDVFSDVQAILNANRVTRKSPSNKKM